jgi:hypothetical protein
MDGGRKFGKFTTVPPYLIYWILGCVSFGRYIVISARMDFPADDREFHAELRRFEAIFGVPEGTVQSGVSRLFVVGNHDVGLGPEDCPACRAR